MKKNLILSLVILILISTINQTSAVLVWDEDFENPPYDDWFLLSYDAGGYVDPFQPMNYTPIITNGSLNMQAPLPNCQMLADAIHNSSVAYGTWSFDFHIANDQIDKTVFGIMFIGNNYGGDNIDLTGITYQELKAAMKSYIIYISPGKAFWLGENTISLWLWIGREHHTQGDFDIYEALWMYRPSSPNDLVGSHHMNITRKFPSGEFSVDLDSERLFQVTNNEITTSEIFEFALFEGEISFDNLTVEDHLSPTTTTTTTPTETSTDAPPTSVDTTTTITSTRETTGLDLGVVLVIVMVSIYHISKRRR